MEMVRTASRGGSVNVDDDEHILKEHWIPDGHQVILPQRKDIMVIPSDRGGVEYHAIAAERLVDYLRRANIINAASYEDARVFKAWRDQHRAALGQQQAVSTESSTSIYVKLRAYGFILILRRLAYYDERLISKSIEYPSTTSTQKEAKLSAEIYRRAFLKLRKAFDPIREQIAYLESLDDATRDEREKEALKIFLDKLKENA